MSITDWPTAERPREKLLQRGASSLSDAELLAIFLRTGVKGKSAVDLARDLLTRFGNLTKLFTSSEKDFCDIHGMGQAKYVQFQAVLELSRRALHEEMETGDALNSPGAVRDYLQLLLRGRQQEVFMAIFLDLCVAVKNVEIAEQAHVAQGRSARLLHINFVKADVASPRHRAVQ